MRHIIAFATVVTLISLTYAGTGISGLIQVYSGEHGDYSITISVDSNIYSKKSTLAEMYYFEATHLETVEKIQYTISSLYPPTNSGENTIVLTTRSDDCYSLLLLSLSKPFQVDTLFKSCTAELIYWIRDSYFLTYSESTGILAISGASFGSREHWPTAITRIVDGIALDTIRLVNATYPTIVSDGESILIMTVFDGNDGDSTLFGIVLYDIKRDTLFMTPEDGLTRVNIKCAKTGRPVFYMIIDNKEKKRKIIQWEPESNKETVILEKWYPQVIGDYYVTRDTLYYSMKDMAKADTSWQTLSIELPK